MKRLMTRSTVFVAALALFAVPSMALTVTNQDNADNSVLVDEGNVEIRKTIPAGKSMTLKDVCKQGCGLTGPRGFTRMAEQGDKIEIRNGDVWGTYAPGS